MLNSPPLIKKHRPKVCQNTSRCVYKNSSWLVGLCVSNKNPNTQWENGDKAVVPAEWMWCKTYFSNTHDAKYCVWTEQEQMGRASFYIDLPLATALFTFLGLFSSRLFSLTPLEIMSVDITLYVWGLILRETDTPAYTQPIPTSDWVFIVSSLTNAFYNICTCNIHTFSTRIVDFSTNIQF